MLTFVYKAKDKSGNVLSGEVEAVSESAAAKLIRGKDLVAISLKKRSRGFFGRRSDKVSKVEIVNFTRQLSTMINSGLSIIDSLVILRNQSKPIMQKVVSQILTDVEGGESLSKSFEKHTNVFPTSYIAIIQSGEVGGVLDKVLVRLADNLEKEEQFRSKIKGAMIYPAIIVFGMVAVSIIMMIFVVPKMTSLYSELDLKLPLATRILIGISNALFKYWPVTIVFAFVVFYVFSFYIKTTEGRKNVDKAILKIPIFGELQRSILLTDFTRTLSLLMSAGVSIIDALNVAAGVVKNSIIGDAVRDASKQVEKGFPIAYSFAKHPEAFPYILSQMTAVGEQTGKTDEVLFKVSNIFETESDQKVKALTSAMEPIIMIVLGLGVAFLVVAIIMPIYSLTSQLGV